MAFVCEPPATHLNETDRRAELEWSRDSLLCIKICPKARSRHEHDKDDDDYDVAEEANLDGGWIHLPFLIFLRDLLLLLLLISVQDFVVS